MKHKFYRKFHLFKATNIDNECNVLITFPSKKCEPCYGILHDKVKFPIASIEPWQLMQSRAPIN